MNVPFTFGLPLPEGIIRSSTDIALLDAVGRATPVAAQPLATWPDGSFRWVLLDFLGSFTASEKSDWTVVLGEDLASSAPEHPVRVEQTGSIIRVSNSRLEAEFRAEQFQLFHTLTADGVPLIEGGRSDIMAVSPGGKIFRASYDPAPKLSLEEATPLRAVVRWDGGLFAGDGERLTEYRLKLHFFADNPYIKVEHSVICRELPERGVLLREYRIDLETQMDQRTVKVVRQKVHGVDNFSRLVELRQNARVWLPAPGTDGRPVTALGTLVNAGITLLEDESAFAENAGEYPHFLRPDAPRMRLGGGYAQVYPFLGVRDDRRALVASFLRMAPQYPKGIHADENRLSLEIWPAGSGEWRLPRGVTKTHHLALSFFGRGLAAEEIDNEAIRREFFAWGTLFQDPVTITLEPDYVRATRQVEADRLLPCLPQLYPRLETKLSSLQLHSKPLDHAGIMDYGEAIPGYSAANNEEDQGHEYAMEYFRRGSYEHYLKMAAQMLHNSTVDVVDWDPDPLRMGGTPYHTDYHQDAVCVPSHTWTEGMFEYAYVTGDREAWRVAVGICDWILRYMVGKPQIVKQDGREIGWPIIALVAGYQATWDKRYLDGARELVGYYREKMAHYGELLNNEPPGTDYCLSGYGEYAGFEGMHKLWQVTGDEELRQFALSCLEKQFARGYLNFTQIGRMMDMYAIYAAWDMSRDPKWLELAQHYLPIVLARPSWDGYSYRRIIHYLNLCHEQGWIDDSLVALRD